MGEAGKIGDGPLDNFLTLANGFTQENGGGRFPVGHDVDIHGCDHYSNKSIITSVLLRYLHGYICNANATKKWQIDLVYQCFGRE